mmetsp:Transcript_48677/g.156350  ORF Transcript_48677/g.156350 Transcript_48677/m.156350 type:complete len:227 (+) Transcript_48677:657-1337(+)
MPFGSSARKTCYVEVGLASMRRADAGASHGRVPGVRGQLLQAQRRTELPHQTLKMLPDGCRSCCASGGAVGRSRSSQPGRGCQSADCSVTDSRYQALTTCNHWNTLVAMLAFPSPEWRSGCQSVTRFLKSLALLDRACSLVTLRQSAISRRTAACSGLPWEMTSQLGMPTVSASDAAPSASGTSRNGRPCTRSKGGLRTCSLLAGSTPRARRRAAACECRLDIVMS